VPSFRPSWAFWRRRDEPLDPYEAAAGRMDRQRRAEEAGDVSPPPPDLQFERPPRPGGRTLTALLVVVAVVAVAQVFGSARTPELATDCDAPALALSTDSADRGTPVRWAATGPDEGRYILAVDVVSIAPRPGSDVFDGQPAPGRRLPETQTASEPFRLRDCAADGVFGVRVPAGEHTVTMFRLDDGGSVAVSSHPLEVTE